ncbi:MAG: DUF433 domain-containing protein [Bacteroidota bacterium]
MIDWKNHIGTDRDVLAGKPIIKGTRLSVEFVLERLASGWSENEVLANYPRLTSEDIKAIHAFTYECMRDGLLLAMPNVKRA